ncbi:MAG TPA: EamA family transporter [Vicinamibacterales bacterium]|nr:EamA family transporter [Vicinamibacterales bacterium]
MTLTVWWITCLIWSSVWLFIKIGLRDLPPVTFAATRLVVAIAVFLPILWIRAVPLPRRAADWSVMAIAGLLVLGVNYALLFWGAQFIPSGLVAVLGATTPAFSLVLGHYMLKDEPFTLRALGAIALGIGGVWTISADQLHLSGRQALFGALAVTAASAFVGFAYVFVKARRRPALRPEVITCGQMIAAVGPMLLFAAVREGNPLAHNWTLPAIGCVLYLAVFGSVAATWLNYWLLERMSATAVLSMGLVEPFIAILLGAVVLGERLSVNAGLGGGLVLCSIFMITIPFQRRRA